MYTLIRLHTHTHTHSHTHIYKYSRSTDEFEGWPWYKSFRINCFWEPPPTSLVRRCSHPVCGSCSFRVILQVSDTRKRRRFCCNSIYPLAEKLIEPVTLTCTIAASNKGHTVLSGKKTIDQKTTDRTDSHYCRVRNTPKSRSRDLRFFISVPTPFLRVIIIITLYARHGTHTRTRNACHASRSITSITTVPMRYMISTTA